MAMIPMQKAKICLDCEGIFDKGDTCPSCASGQWKWLSTWLSVDAQEV